MKIQKKLRSLVYFIETLFEQYCHGCLFTFINLNVEVRVSLEKYETFWLKSTTSWVLTRTNSESIRIYNSQMYDMRTQSALMHTLIIELSSRAKTTREHPLLQFKWGLQQLMHIGVFFPDITNKNDPNRWHREFDWYDHYKSDGNILAIYHEIGWQ